MGLLQRGEGCQVGCHDASPSFLDGFQSLPEAWLNGSFMGGLKWMDGAVRVITEERTNETCACMGTTFVVSETGFLRFGGTSSARSQRAPPPWATSKYVCIVRLDKRSASSTTPHRVGHGSRLGFLSPRPVRARRHPETGETKQKAEKHGDSAAAGASRDRRATAAAARAHLHVTSHLRSPHARVTAHAPRQLPPWPILARGASAVARPDTSPHRAQRPPYLLIWTFYCSFFREIAKRKAPSTRRESLVSEKIHHVRPPAASRPCAVHRLLAKLD